MAALVYCVFFMALDLQDDYRRPPFEPERQKLNSDTLDAHFIALGARHFKERQAAQTALENCRPELLRDRLKAGRADRDPEVRRRCQALTEYHDQDWPQPGCLTRKARRYEELMADLPSIYSYAGGYPVDKAPRRLALGLPVLATHRAMVARGIIYHFIGDENVTARQPEGLARLLCHYYHLRSLRAHRCAWWAYTTETEHYATWLLFQDLRALGFSRAWLTRLLDDMGTRTGALPYRQHTLVAPNALFKLWLQMPYNDTPDDNQDTQGGAVPTALDMVRAGITRAPAPAPPSAPRLLDRLR